MAEGLGLAQNWGVVIADVTARGPADAAGVRPQDVVVAVDGHAILGVTAFAAVLYQHPSDQILQVDVLRGKQKLSFNIAAIEAPDRMDQLADVADPVKSYSARLGIFGLSFVGELRSLLPDVRIGSGVIVVGQAPGFNSVKTGLRTGDVIHSLNHMPVESVEELNSAVAQLKPGSAAVLQIERQGQFQYLAFEME
jgi:S1-C subfamily serine protease